MLRTALIALLLVGCSHFGSKDVPPPQHVAQPEQAAKPAPAAQKAAPEAAPAPPPKAPALPGEEEALANAPQVGAIPQFDAPVPRAEKLPNGLPLYVIERPGAGIEAVQLWIRGGGVADPEKLAGVHSILAALMETGAAGRSQTEIAAAADAIGMTLSVQATDEAVIVTGSAMTTNLAAMAKLLADVALRPNLAQAEFDKVRMQREAQLVAQNAEPSVAAPRAFRAAAFAGTPLGRPVEGTLASVKALTLADAKKIYAMFGAQRAALVAVGGAKSADVAKVLRAQFGTWKAKGMKAEPLRVEPPANRPRLVLVDFPGKPQSVVYVGQPSVPRSSPDYLALEVLNAVLGGSFTSRLNQNLREAHGYSYGAGSTFRWTSAATPFYARSSVKTDVTGPAVGEMLGELQRILDPLDGAEVDKGRALLAYQLSERMAHATLLAGAVGEMWLYNLPADELKTYVPRLRALTAQSVQAAAKKALDPAHMTIAIAGDRSKIGPQLSALKLPEPELRDAAGAKVP